MKDMLCINAEQCGDDVVIVHDGDVQINLIATTTLVLQAIVCTGTLRFYAHPGHKSGSLHVRHDVTCGALVTDNRVPIVIRIYGSLCLRSVLPFYWRSQEWMEEGNENAMIILFPPTPQQYIRIDGAFTQSPGRVQPPRPAWHCSCVAP
jgi:hypothetical protein